MVLFFSASKREKRAAVRTGAEPSRTSGLCPQGQRRLCSPGGAGEAEAEAAGRGQAPASAAGAGVRGSRTASPQSHGTHWDGTVVFTAESPIEVGLFLGLFFKVKAKDCISVIFLLLEPFV